MYDNRFLELKDNVWMVAYPFTEANRSHPKFTRMYPGNPTVLEKSTGTANLSIARAYRDRLLEEINEELSSPNMGIGSYATYQAAMNPQSRGHQQAVAAKLATDATRRLIQQAQQNSSKQQDDAARMAAVDDALSCLSTRDRNLSDARLNKIKLSTLDTFGSKFLQLTHRDVAMILKISRQGMAAKKNALACASQLWEAYEFYYKTAAQNPFQAHDVQSTVKALTKKSTSNKFDDKTLNLLLHIHQEDYPTVQEKQMAKRLLAHIKFMLYTGCRVIESCHVELMPERFGEQLRWCRIKGDEKESEWRDRVIPVHPELLDTLKRYRPLSVDQLKRELDKLWLQQKLQQFHGKAFRRTVASRFIRARVPSHIAAQLGGYAHKDNHASTYNVYSPERPIVELEQAILSLNYLL